MRTILLLLIILFAPLSHANGVYTQSIQRVASIGDKFAVDRVEAFLWGYGFAANNAGCPPEENADFRREATRAWLNIKYEVDSNTRLVDVMGKYFSESYECGEKTPNE